MAWKKGREKKGGGGGLTRSGKGSSVGRRRGNIADEGKREGKSLPEIPLPHSVLPNAGVQSHSHPTPPFPFAPKCFHKVHFFGASSTAKEEEEGKGRRKRSLCNAALRREERKKDTTQYTHTEEREI